MLSHFEPNFIEKFWFFCWFMVVLGMDNYDASFRANSFFLGKQFLEGVQLDPFVH